jgi:hypothetical protein
MGLHQMKKLLQSKGKSIECEKNYASSSPDKELTTRIHEEIKKNKLQENQ